VSATQHDAPRVDWWLLTVPMDERIARARIRYSHHVLVRVRTPDLEGWGAAPLYARVPHQVRALRPRLHRLTEFLDTTRPTAARALCADALPDAPDVRSALDGALWELEARQDGCSVARLLGATDRSVAITEQMFADAAARAEQVWPVLRARGTRTLKVKVCGRPDVDLAVLRRLREVVGADVRLRVDANRGYSPVDGLRVAPRLAELGIEEWEEPLAAGFEDVARIRGETGLRVILDESIRSNDDLDRALACGAVDLLNLKLSRLGGITAANDYRQRCAEAGVGVLIGCNEDLGPAMAAVLHAAAAWSPFETEGLGWLRLGLDLADPSPELVDGGVDIRSAPGWGLTVEPRVHARSDSARLPLPQPVHLSAWSTSFAARSVARRQHQRACNAWLRTRALAERTVRGGSASPLETTRLRKVLR
jgi:L-alanine-DL-glutamate epimerase-like enolase superfamily enzyme